MLVIKFKLRNNYYRSNHNNCCCFKFRDLY